MCGGKNDILGLSGKDHTKNAVHYLLQNLDCHGHAAYIYAQLSQ